MVSLLLQSGTVRLVSVVFAVVTLATVWSSVERVLPHERRVLTVFGEYRKLLEPGFTLIPPFVSETHVIDMRIQSVVISDVEATTRDNSPVTVDAVVYIKVMDAKKAFLEVEDYKRAVSNLAQTTLRVVIQDMELNDTLNRYQMIDRRLQMELDKPTDEWGVRVDMVEVREVTSPNSYD